MFNDYMIHLLSYIAQIVAIPAFLISLWNLLYPSLAGTKISIKLESHVALSQGLAGQMQFEQGEQQGKIASKKTIGFNNLATVFATGPSNNWETVKFNSATVRIPDGRLITFACRCYISELMNARQPAFRNTPLAVKGGESKTVTSRYQNNELPEWILGEYEIQINATDGKGKVIQVNPFKITLNSKNLISLKNSNLNLLIDFN